METIGYCSKFGHPFRLQVKPLTTVLAVSDVYIGFELILYGTYVALIAIC